MKTSSFVRFGFGFVLDFSRATAELLGQRFKGESHTKIPEQGYFSRVFYSRGKIKSAREEVYHDGVLVLTQSWVRGNKLSLTRYNSDGSQTVYRMTYNNGKSRHKFYEKAVSGEKTRHFEVESKWSRDIWKPLKDDPQVKDLLVWGEDVLNRARAGSTRFYQQKFKYIPNAFPYPYEKRSERRVFSPIGGDPRSRMLLQRSI